MAGRRFTAGTAILLFSCLTGATALCAEEDTQPGPASVLLVTLDTTRADHLGCYGAEFAATPNLDRLAREGVRFDQAISPTPLTLPSHATIFTGQVPRRHGVRNNALFRLGSEPQVLADVLRRHGYNTAGFVSSVVLDRIGGLERGFEHYDDTVRVGSREAFNYTERAASQTNAAVFPHLDTLPEPFFLWVHYFDPHLPYVPPEPFQERFHDRPYDGEIAFMDEQLGQLLRRVGKKAQSLVVVVAGDHGESLGEHGEAAHGVFVYQATQRIPLIIAGPGVPRGRVVETRVGLVDLAPTLLDLLGLAGLSDTDGRTLVPLFQGKKLRPQIYELESLFPLFAYGWAPVRGLVRAGYKHIEAPNRELYRLESDPNELNDLAGVENKLTARMARELTSITSGDAVRTVAPDPELAEQRRRLESLGYVSGGPTSPEEDVSIDPKDGIAWIADLEAGRQAYQTGNAAAGITPLKRLLSRNPRNVPALLALAMCYLGNGEPEKAVQADRRALAFRPDDDLVHFNLANALTALGEANSEARTEARVHYERTLELNPRFADAYVNYASLLERDGAGGEALALLGRARTAGVRDPELETRIAVLELKRGDVAAAKEAFRQVLKLHPHAPDALEAMARVHERQGHHAKAADYYGRLLALTPPGDPATARLRSRIAELSRQD